MPTPLLEMAEVAPVMSPRTRMLPLPSKSTTKPPVDMAPDKVRVPMAERNKVWPPRVIAPPKELAPLTLMTAPVAPMPVPATARASAPTEMPPLSSSAAPFAMVVPPATPPSAVELLMARRPEVTVVAPA